MNILIIAPYLPSFKAPHAGGVCMAKEREELEKKHNVYTLSFIQNEVEKEDFERYLKKNPEYNFAVYWNKKKKMLAVLSHFYMANQFAARSSNEFWKILKYIVKEKKIEAIHADYSVMGQYIKIKKIFPNIKFNIILHDVTYQSYIRQKNAESNKFKRLYLILQAALIYKYEKRYVKKADRVITFSDKDRKLIKELYNRENIDVINTFFDLEKALKKGENRIKNFHNTINDSICFLGQMSRKENADAANELIDIVESIENNNICIYIVGNNPSNELKNRECDKVHITGFVDDIDEYLLKCKLAVFPLRVGAGIKIKVLHCMALGIPIITTSVGAEGIDEEGEVLNIRNTAQEISSAILELINNDELQKINAKNEMRYITNKFSWEKTSKVFSHIYSKK